jgi:hypothetical protein
MVVKKFVWAETEVGKGQRITIGQDLTRELPWLTGSKGIEAWVLTLEPGRYRLIPSSDFEANQELKEIMERLTAVQHGSLETVLEADSPEFAVFPSRLLPATISPGSSWRLNLSSVPLLDANGKKIELFILMLRHGYVELWSGLRFAQAQNTDIERLMR